MRVETHACMQHVHYCCSTLITMGLCRKKRVLRLLHIKPQQILFSEPPLVTYGRTDGQTGVFLQLFAANTSKCLAGKLIGVFKGGSTAIIKRMWKQGI